MRGSETVHLIGGPLDGEAWAILYGANEVEVYQMDGPQITAPDTPVNVRRLVYKRRCPQGSLFDFEVTP